MAVLIRVCFWCLLRVYFLFNSHYVSFSVSCIYAGNYVLADLGSGTTLSVLYFNVVL